MSRIWIHIKEGFKGVFRHFALSLSSISSVTVTLVLMSIFLFLNINLDAITKNVEESVQIHVQIDREFIEAEESVEDLKSGLATIKYVESVEFSSREDELEYFIELDDSEESEDLYGQYRGDTNPFMDAFLVTIDKGEHIKEVTDEIKEYEGVFHASSGGDGTAKLMSTLEQIRNVGFITVIALGVVAVFLISNTVRVTVQSREKEISIMRTVGASNWYIRWPFIIEGMLIGLIGSIIPVLLSIFVYKYIMTGTGGIIWSSMFRLVPADPLVYQISGVLTLIGMSVGALGSLFTVGRLLRWSR